MTAACVVLALLSVADVNEPGPADNSIQVHLFQPDWSESTLVYRSRQDAPAFREEAMTREANGWWSTSVVANRIEFSFQGSSGRIDLGATHGCYPGDHYVCEDEASGTENFRSSAAEVWVKNGLLFPSSPDQDTSGAEFTVLSLNLHTYQEFKTDGIADAELTDDLARERVEQHGPLFDRIAAAILALDADIVCLQEVGEWSGSDTGDQQAAQFGESQSNMLRQIMQRIDDQSYEYTLDWSHYGWDVWREGSAILSKHPLLDSGSRFISHPDNSSHDFWKSRNVPMARIRLPELGEVAIFSVHAGWWDDEEEPFQAQFERLTAWAGELRSPDSTVIFCGDFNQVAGTQGQQFMTNGTGYSDQYHSANPDGLLDPTIGGKIDGWHVGGGKRIDYILMNDSSPFQVRIAQRIFTEKVFGRVSDHTGIYAHFGPREEAPATAANTSTSHSVVQTIDSVLAHLEASGTDGVEYSVWLGPANGPAWYRYNASAIRPAASAIKTALAIEFLADRIESLDRPFAALDRIVNDPDGAAIGHFDTEQRQSARSDLTGLTPRQLVEAMLHKKHVKSNAAYNAAANIIIEYLGGPATSTEKIHRRFPAAKDIVIARYMLADRAVGGDNLLSAEALATVLQHLAGCDGEQELIGAARAALLLSTDPSKGQHFYKGGTLSSAPQVRIEAGWWEHRGMAAVYVVIATRDNSHGGGAEFENMKADLSELSSTVQGAATFRSLVRPGSRCHAADE